MTTENIDINNLKGWEDAFSYPVQSIRKTELQLRRQINDRNERLRSKVGCANLIIYFPLVIIWKLLKFNKNLQVKLPGTSRERREDR